jgi:hypothetical protein
LLHQPVLHSACKHKSAVLCLTVVGADHSLNQGLSGVWSIPKILFWS